MENGKPMSEPRTREEWQEAAGVERAVGLLRS